MAAPDFSDIDAPAGTGVVTLSATPGNATLITAPDWCGRLSWRVLATAAFDAAAVTSEYAFVGADGDTIDPGAQTVPVALHSINTNTSGRSRTNAPFTILIASSSTVSAVVRLTFELGTA